MTVNKLLKTIEEQFNASLTGSLFDSDDNMKFSASIPIVDKMAFVEAITYGILKEYFGLEKEDIEKRKDMLLSEVLALNTIPAKLPKITAIDDENSNRIKEIDEDTFAIITSAGAGSMAVYLSNDKVNSVKRIAGYYGLPSTDSKYSKNGIVTFDVTKDEVELEDGTKVPTLRAYWIDSNYRVKTSVINPLNGIYLDEDIIVDNTTEKAVTDYQFRAIQNEELDKLVVYAIKDANGKFTVKTMVKGGDKSIWIDLPLLENDGTNSDIVSDVIEVDGTFYVLVSNNVNRIYLAKIWKNEQGDFEREIIVRDGWKYTETRLFQVENDLWITSAEQKVLVVPVNGDYFFDEIELAIPQSTHKGYFAILGDGTYISGDSVYSKDGKEIMKLPDYIQTDKLPARWIEYKTIMPYIKEGETIEDGVYLLDMTQLSDVNTFKGI